MTTSLFRKFTAPALPEWGVQYEQRFGNGYNRVLRVFFNDIISALSTLSGYGTHGSFYSTVTQTNPVANTVNLITLNSTVNATNVRFDIVNPSRIYVDYSGVYNFQFSLQLDKSGGAASSVYIWYRVNGVDAPYSASTVVIDGPNAEVVSSWNFMLTLNAGDYFELVWSSPDTAVVMGATPASPPVPAVPSVIMTVVYESPLNR